MTNALRTRQPNTPTPTIENYLSILYVLERDGEEVVAARLAKTLKVAPPTVTVTLKRMERDGWLNAHPTQGIHLTQAGREAAGAVLRRHMLTEWLLARMLKMPWSRIHPEAHQLEHSISAVIEDRLRANLDNPQTCPHGNPLPGFEHVSRDWHRLTEIQVGEEVVVRRIHENAEDDPDLMRFLETNGILPGTAVVVDERLDFNQTLNLRVGSEQVSVGYPAGQFIYVELPASDPG